MSKLPQNSQKFKLFNEFKPAGDQPKAIDSLVGGLKKGLKHQTLLGVTGSGKTFTAASVIAQVQKPTLVIAHNKTLAAQLAQEYREFFPENAVHYFVSYYDYYQPEAYMPVTDTFIEKEAQINKEIDRLRHASTQALLMRKDVIIVASVSCIYGLGSPAEYEKVHLKIERGMALSRQEFLRKLVSLHFERTNADLTPGSFRALGTSVEIMPVNEKFMYRIDIDKDEIASIQLIDPVSRHIVETVENFFLFPAKHFITGPDEAARAMKTIKAELEDQLGVFQKEGKLLEYERLKRRTGYDLAMIREIGYCNGIENYSRHFSGRIAGEAPDTLLSYFPHIADGTPNGKPDFLTIIDESHVTVPQIGGMFAGDASRKKTLVEHGFRLPSAQDNRPLKFSEFEERVGQVVYTSATPGKYEHEKSENIVEQIIRPTGLIDPEIFVFPAAARAGDSDGGAYPGQIKHFIAEAEKVIEGGHRVIATTLTKKMAEDLSVFLKEKGIKAEYLHSDIQTLERIEILTKFRKGEFDCLVGVNLLREGLDLPELAFIGILDADREGFLRSETSLIQIIGRAARNILGKVYLYADKSTGAMEYAISETKRRRELQTSYNTKHGITPKTISKKINDITEHLRSDHAKAVDELLLLDEKIYATDPTKLIRRKEKQMNAAVKILDFETAAIIRDEIAELEKRAHKVKK
ncbi:MAG: excinuclease ABC subunit UvrB [Patescibacteria group bacterium]